MKSNFANYTPTEDEQDLIEYLEAETGWDVQGASSVKSANGFRAAFNQTLSAYIFACQDIHHVLEHRFRDYKQGIGIYDE